MLEPRYTTVGLLTARLRHGVVTSVIGAREPSQRESASIGLGALRLKLLLLPLITVESDSC